MGSFWKVGVLLVFCYSLKSFVKCEIVQFNKIHHGLEIESELGSDKCGELALLNFVVFVNSGKEPPGSKSWNLPDFHMIIRCWKQNARKAKCEE